MSGSGSRRQKRRQQAGKEDMRFHEEEEEDAEAEAEADRLLGAGDVEEPSFQQHPRPARQQHHPGRRATKVVVVSPSEGVQKVIFLLPAWIGLECIGSSSPSLLS